jgi:hypothetical protein
MSSVFPKMVEIVPEAQIGIASVEHFDVSQAASRFSALRIGNYVPAGRYAKLKVNGFLVMSDTSMEHQTNWEFVDEARGNVLVAGLGLGMILHPVLAKPEVLSITVIEKHADVISLVGPTVTNPKLTILNADIYEWKPEKGAKFDTLYFDIWAEQSTDTLEDMRKLHMRFRSFKAKDGWMNSWRRDELRARKRSDQRRGW